MDFMELCAADFINLKGYIYGSMALTYRVQEEGINYQVTAESVQVSPARQLAAADSSQALLGQTYGAQQHLIMMRVLLPAGQIAGSQCVRKRPRQSPAVWDSLLQRH